MFTPHVYHNARPDGFPVLQTSDGRFAPLQRTELTGTVTGPLAALHLTQLFALSGSASDPPIEVVYRFPLPGDAAVTGVRVRFGDTDISTTLKERQKAEAEYAAGKRAGKQSALLTRESADVFTLSVAGVRPGQDVRVETSFVQLARPEGDRFALRVPLTTAPRFVREDEAGTRPTDGQPLAVLRDPGHRFTCNIEVRGTGPLTSSTHELDTSDDQVMLKAGEVVPDRDLVLTWSAAGPGLRVWAEPTADATYLLALAQTAPAAGDGVPREVVLLVDHSGSMQGPKWEAADWAVERFLGSLTPNDRFALGVFHDRCKWFAKQPQPASAGAVKQAVQFLKAARDQGGTELGVALEQALKQARAAGEVSRHVLIVTDAEVSDAGRLLRLVDAESERPDRRRVSVLCIDAAPNAALATELAEQGGGVCRFLTSDPNADDITTALDEVLTDWDAPAAVGLTLELNRPTVEAAGRLTGAKLPGPSATIDLGDPPAGRPVWTAARVPTGGPLTARLTAGVTVFAETTAEAGGVPGLKALFGADRIRRLEHLMHSHRPAAEVRDQLAKLAVPADASVYAENANTAERVRPVLVREALAAGLPSAETAFVAVRAETGEPVAGTVVVANARPAGWAEGGVGTASAKLFCMAASGSMTLGGGGRGGYRSVLRSPVPAPPSPAAPPDDGVESVDSMLMEFDDAPDLDDDDMDDDEDVTTDFDALERARPVTARPAEVRVSIPAGRHPTAAGAVLFDSARDASPLPDACRLTGLTLTGPTAGPGVTLLLFVGDMTTPRAKVRVADLLKAGRRPLNVTKARGQAVRLVLDAPAGEWAAGVPPLELSLSWE